MTRRLAIAAIIISILSLSATIVINVVKLRLAYFERVSFEFLDEDFDYIHGLSLHNSKSNEPAITRMVIWKKMRVANNSGKPVSVVSLFYREDDSVTHDAILPLFGKIQYTDVAVNYDDPIELPIYLNPGQTVDFYALLPVSVQEDIGLALYQVLFKRMPDREALIWLPFVLGPVFFDLLYTEDSVFLDDLLKKKGARVDHITYQTIDVTRTLLTIKEGAYSFLDDHNDAFDGFSYERGNSVFSKVYDHLRVEDRSTWTMPDLPFKLYHIYLRTNNGNVYHEWLSSDALPFKKYLRHL